jgi:hypothetical protein
MRGVTPIPTLLVAATLDAPRPAFKSFSCAIACSHLGLCIQDCCAVPPCQNGAPLPLCGPRSDASLAAHMGSETTATSTIHSLDKHQASENTNKRAHQYRDCHLAAPAGVAARMLCCNTPCVMSRLSPIPRYSARLVTLNGPNDLELARYI